jgi:hypothetical protein
VKDLLIQMLDDQESFVYLAAVHALARIVDMNRKLLIPSLLEIFGGKGNISETPVTLKIRAALGEVLSICIRRARDLVPLFVPSIVAECLQICRNRVYLPPPSSSPSSPSSASSGIETNLSKMQIHVNLEESEVSEKTDAEIAKINETIESVSLAADSIYLRQSAYSLLSEAIACGGWTATKYLSDTLDVAIGTLQLEYNSHRHHRHPNSSANPQQHQQQHQQENLIMRRSSIFLIKYILQGLQEKLFYIPFGGNYLKDIKRILTVCCRENEDAIVSFQAQRGLFLLEEMVKEQLRPKEEGLPKIRILN